MSHLKQDLQLGLRNLMRQPALSLTIVGMLALGIGGTTAIFSIFNGLFLQPLPVEEHERLGDIDEETPKWDLEYTGVAAQDFAACRAQNSTFDSLAAYYNSSFNLSGQGAAERIDGLQVTHDLLKGMRLKPVLGRGFLPEEDKPGAPRVAMISYGVWQRMFGGRRDVLGRGINLNAERYEIIGVLPKEAVAPGRGEVWSPLRLDFQRNDGWWMGSSWTVEAGRYGAAGTRRSNAHPQVDDRGA